MAQAGNGLAGGSAGFLVFGLPGLEFFAVGFAFFHLGDLLVEGLLLLGRQHRANGALLLVAGGLALAFQGLLVGFGQLVQVALGQLAVVLSLFAP